MSRSTYRRFFILDHVINNHGGLYGRVTYEMKLYPFTLKECELFLDSRNICMSRYDMTQTYMMVGGIPYYLKYFKKELSLPQNIDNIFFSDDALLKDEYGISQLRNSGYDMSFFADQ